MAANRVTIWHNPKCGTSRKVLEMIRAEGIEPTIVDYVKTPPSVAEIKSGDWYLAVRGSGVRGTRATALASGTDIRRMFWGYGFRGRPARPTVEVLGDLIDASSVGGGPYVIEAAYPLAA